MALDFACESVHKNSLTESFKPPVQTEWKPAFLTRFDAGKLSVLST